MRVASPISISAAAIILSSAAFLSLRLHAQSTPPATPAHKPAEEQFKNIQVLKGVPADQLVPSMQFISASLGVECEYCHVEHANEKDDKKPKLAARKMITMMQAINKENFEGHREVTCYSCHRGAANPVATPVIAADESAPRAEARTTAPEEKAALPVAAQLLDKYLAAVGGADALHNITTRIQKGNLTVPGGQPSPIDVYAQAPDKRVSVMHAKNGDSITAFNGQQGWLGTSVRMTGQHVQRAPLFGSQLRDFHSGDSIATPGDSSPRHEHPARRSSLLSFATAPRSASPAAAAPSASAPTIPQLVQTMRGPKVGTAMSSGQRSALSTA